jgi:hypothetical protein
MFWADSSAAAAALGSVLPPGPADAVLSGEAVALAAADGATDGSTEAEGAADPEASADGMGVADAGA